MKNLFNGKFENSALKLQNFFPLKSIKSFRFFRPDFEILLQSSIRRKTFQNQHWQETYKSFFCQTKVKLKKKRIQKTEF